MYPLDREQVLERLSEGVSRHTLVCEKWATLIQMAQECPQYIRRDNLNGGCAYCLTSNSRYGGCESCPFYNYYGYTCDDSLDGPWYKASMAYEDWKLDHGEHTQALMINAFIDMHSALVEIPDEEEKND